MEREISVGGYAVGVLISLFFYSFKKLFSVWHSFCKRDRQIKIYMVTKQIRISKTKWVECYDMFYNVYRMTVQIKFDGSDRYFRFSFNFLANDENEAKDNVNKAIAENTCYAPENINDDHNFNIFVNKVYEYVDRINDKRK